MPAEEFKYLVPRYRCQECLSFLLADVSLCPEVRGYNMAMCPVEYFSPAVGEKPSYHIHWTEKTTGGGEDELAKYDSHPGGDHGAELNAALKAAGPLFKTDRAQSVPDR